MSDPLRSALRELGDQLPPADLADRALARARRDRRRHGATVLVGAVAAVAAVAVPTAVLRSPAQPPAAPASTAAPAPGPVTPVWVSGYTSVSGPESDRLWEAHVYDPATRGFRAVPVSEARVVAVSPDGGQAVVGRAGGLQRMVVVPVDRLVAGLTEADWQRPSLPPATWWRWSPDGTRLLTGDGQYRPTAAVVVDARTRAVTEVPLQLDELTSADHGLTWGPGGRGFLTWRSTTDEYHPGPGEVVVYDEGGQPTRRYPMPALADEVWPSPDGSRVLVISRMPDPPARPLDQSWLLDLRTAAVTSLQLSPDFWYDDGRLVRVDIPDRGDPTINIVTPDERVVRRRTLALPDGTALIRVLVARGGPPPGAIVL